MNSNMFSLLLVFLFSLSANSHPSSGLVPCYELDKLIPDPQNCSRFYECSLSGWVNFDCPSVLLFNPATLQCDWPEKVVCDNETLIPSTLALEPCSELDKLIPDPQDCSRFYECSLSGWIKLECPSVLLFNPKTLLCDYPENVVCGNETLKTSMSRLEPCSELDKLIPDLQNCSRFYECSLSGWVNFNCSKGLLFNPNTLLCDYPENVVCGNETLKTLEPCTEVDKLKPDPKNCSRFYECTLAGWVGEACNPDLYFNPDTLQCDYPENVQCDIKIPRETTSRLEPCSELDKLIPDPQDCSRFFECSLSGWVNFNCSKGLLFNPNTLLCDWPENVVCSNETLKTSSSRLEPCSELDKLIPDPQDCSRFFECSLSGWVNFNCSKGLLFNPNTLLCDWPENVVCSNETLKTLEPCTEVDKLKPDPKNCSRFYECTLAGWVGEACNADLYFNPDTLQCDYPENVQCDIKIPREQAATNSCNEEDYGRLYPDPLSCTRFLQCSPLGLISLPCAFPLVFNPATLLCDYADNVLCNSTLYT